MSKLMEDYVEYSLEKYGEEKRLEELACIARNLMNSMGWSLEQTLKNMQVSNDDRAILIKRIQ